MPAASTAETNQTTPKASPSSAPAQTGDAARPGAPTESPLLALVRAMARADARRLFHQVDEEGRLGVAATLALAALALLLIVLRAWFR
jgi:hypothetical protein